MKKINSRYKLVGGFGLLSGLVILPVFWSYELIANSVISYDKVDFLHDQDALLIYLISFTVTFLFLGLLVTQCRFLIVDETGITFVNPILPFLRKTKKWADIDYYILVDEVSRYNTKEAVWLIRNGKLTGRFSSFYYTNYKDLKKQIKSRFRGKRNLNPLEQFAVILGLKKLK